MDITKEKWDAYVDVQQSGITNMWAVDVVIDTAMQYYGIELTEDECLYIMKHYSELKELHG